MTSKDRSQLLDKLVGDCIAYSLKPQAALQYIKQMYGVISERTFFGRRRKLLSDQTTNNWYSDFARVRFVRMHCKIIDDLERIYDDTNAQIFVETRKSPRNEYVILKLKTKLEETADVLSKFASDTPVIDAIRKRMEAKQKDSLQ